jgi:hypothetical protein
MMPSKMTAADRTKPVRFHLEIVHYQEKEPQEYLLWLSTRRHYFRVFDLRCSDFCCPLVPLRLALESLFLV